MMKELQLSEPQHENSEVTPKRLLSINPAPCSAETDNVCEGNRTSGRVAEIHRRGKSGQLDSCSWVRFSRVSEKH